METATIPAAPPGDTRAAAATGGAKVGTDLRVDVIQDEKQFLAMGPLWDQLVEEAGVDHPFMRHEWVRSWWESFKPAGRLYILLVTDGDRPIALAPLMFDLGRVYGCRLRRLRGISNVYTERFDFILARRPAEACRAIWNHLSAQAAHWDMLELRQIPEGGKVNEHLIPAAFDDRYLLGQWPSSQDPHISIDRPWDAYVKSLSRKHLSNLRGRLKGLHRIGQVDCEIVAGGEALDQAIDEAFLLEGAAWKGNAGTAIMSRPDRACFYRQMLRRCSDRGWTRLFFLTLDGKRIAAQIALVVSGKLYILKSGYDPRYAAFAPSLVLCDSVLQDAWKQGLREVDLLGDIERWKLEWGAKPRPHSWLFIFPNRARVRLLHRIKFVVLPKMHRHPIYLAARHASRRFGFQLHKD